MDRLNKLNKKKNNSLSPNPVTLLLQVADWSRRDFDVTLHCSAAADSSRNYVGYLGCFNVNNCMLRISVPVDQLAQAIQYLI